MNKNLLKIGRYAKIYGIKRTFIKAVGRKRFIIPLPNFKKIRNISIIGCGQFAFSTIAYFLYSNGKNKFLGCYDINISKSETLAKLYGFKKVYKTFNELIDDKDCKLIYIASNHASHTTYAIEALKQNISVYIEKPISTTFEQFKALLEAIKNSNGDVFVGYNRPFSSAIIKLVKKIENINKPISLSCFISGHLIPENHWYRNPEEGTRICGNVGHWIDLSVHLLNKVGSPPNEFNINITYADNMEPDDNICISLATDRNDIISIFLSSRSEPFEGINETINFQCGDIIAKIDDFRSITIWQNEKKKTKHYHPKDVGHKMAILQPFDSIKRDFNEIKISTLIMLKIKDMVLSGKNHESINLNNEFSKLNY